jgi:hypothetical protein
MRAIITLVFIICAPSYLAFIFPVGPKTTLSVKLCRDCKHFDPVDKTCKLFYDIDLVSGNRTSRDARSCREIQTRCGIEGTFHELANVGSI